MYQVHKFMDLNPAEVGYFITQVALAGASFGVATDDLTAVGMALNSLFGYRCSPPATAIKAQGPALQAICIDGACPLAPSAVCNSYEPVLIPKNATTNSTVTAPGSLGTATVSMSMSATATMTMSGSTTATMTTKPTSVVTAGAVANGVNLAAVVGGLAALLL